MIQKPIRTSGVPSVDTVIIVVLIAMKYQLYTARKAKVK